MKRNKKLEKSESKNKAWFGVIGLVGVGLVFGILTILFRFKAVKISPKGVPAEFEHVSSNPVLFGVFLSLFILSLIGFIVWVALKQRKSVSRNSKR